MIPCLSGVLVPLIPVSPRVRGSQSNQLSVLDSAVAADVIVPCVCLAVKGRKLLAKASKMCPWRHVMHGCVNP